MEIKGNATISSIPSADGKPSDRRIMSANSPSEPKILCVPGRNETYEEAMGHLAWSFRVEIGAVDFTPAFSRLLFADQVALILKIVQKDYWFENSLLVGRSFGAWILLNALMELKAPYPGTVVLISSVLGFGSTQSLRFYAPRSSRFWEQVKSGHKAPAQRLALIHALRDEQCPIEYAQQLSGLWGVELVSFDRCGHDLGKDILQDAVSEAIHRIWAPVQVSKIKPPLSSMISGAEG